MTPRDSFAKEDENIGSAIPAGIAFFWNAYPRPSYIRLAPGIVQFMRYDWFWRRRPTIRSYPMTPGTTIIVAQSVNIPSYLKETRKTDPPKWLVGQPYSLTTLTFMRDAHKDVISLFRMSDP